MIHTQIEELIPLYALDALDGDEVTEIEQHLRSCDSCLAELDRHRHVAAQLVPDAPASEATWDRIADEIGSHVSTVRSVEFAPADLPSSRTTRWAVATAVAAVIALGVVVVPQLGRSPDAVIAATAERAAGEADSVVADFTVDGVAVAQVVLTADGRGFVIPTDDLDPLDEDRTYQLWVINTDADVISAGVLGAEPVAATFTWTGDVSGFALTREVAGGVVSSAGDVVAVIDQL